MNVGKLPELLTARIARHLPERASLRLWRTFRLLQPLPVRLLRGDTHAGRPGTLLAVGKSPEVDWLPGQFFAGEPAVEPLPPRSVLGLRRRLLAAAPGVDVVLARMDRWRSGAIGGAEFLALPHRIGTRLQIPAVTRDLAMGNNSLSDEFRLIRNRGFSARSSQDAGAIREFYDSFYRPNLERRHGRLSVAKTLAAVETAVRAGGLLQILQAGEVVGGIVFRPRDQELQALALGTRPNPDGRPRPGADAACYYFLIETARSLGCTSIDFGGCRPSLADGVLRYKKKWGMQVVENRHTHHDLLLHWTIASPPVVELVRRNPLIVRDDGRFGALGAGDTTDWRKLALPGIDRFLRLVPGAPFASCRLPDDVAS